MCLICIAIINPSYKIPYLWFANFVMLLQKSISGSKLGVLKVNLSIYCAAFHVAVALKWYHIRNHLSWQYSWLLISIHRFPFQIWRKPRNAAEKRIDVANIFPNTKIIGHVTCSSAIIYGEMDVIWFRTKLPFNSNILGPCLHHIINHFKYTFFLIYYPSFGDWSSIMLSCLQTDP